MSVPNWLGLLKWSLNQGDGTVPSPSHAMSTEDKDFLEKVMKECVQDEPARMQEIMTKLVNSLEAGSCSEDSDEIESYLEELKYIVDQIDMAEIFNKFGGVQCLLKLMEFDSLTIEARCQAGSVLGTICQNNLKVQADIFSKGTLERLVHLFIRIELHQLRAKILYAISCLIRNYSLAEEQFVHSYLLEIFDRVMVADPNEQSALWSRVLYLGAALLNPDSPHGDRIRILVTALLPRSFAAFSSDSVDTREGFLSLLQSFVRYPILTGKNAVAAHKSLLEEMLRNHSIKIQQCRNSIAAVVSEEMVGEFLCSQYSNERDVLESIIASSVEVSAPSLFSPSSHGGSGEHVLLLESPRQAAPNT